MNKSEYYQEKTITNWQGSSSSHVKLIEIRSVDDIKSSLTYAKELGLSIAVKGGGCSYSDVFLNNDGIVLDLINFNKILSFDKEKLRVSLGLKQIQNDPWENVENNYAVGGVYEASVSNITDYGCFAQLEEGIEGLIHLSELDWTSKNIHPSKVVEMEQKIKVMILEIDHDKRRISLGLKQTKANPWSEFSNKYGIGDKVDGQIKSITDFGIFVGLEGDIDGLIHLSDISEDDDPKEALEKYKKGDKLDCIVFAVDADRERISLKLSE